MSTFKRPPPRPAKQYEGTKAGTPRAPAPRVRASVLSLMVAGDAPADEVAPRRAPIQRDPADVWGDKVKASAKGEACTVRLVGVCTFDPTTTIWSHARWGAKLGEAGRGMSTKALDVCGAYACTACDGVYDGQIKAPHLTRDQIDLDWSLGHFRSMGILARKGLL